ncbi:UDP-glycosyltransferase 82A1 [Abeliophyllum distichum]|uniref:UDP-glycosyltransferase 82A1 n=1 Tax=Abeliophyllum distichum TaxID=126358 RepID=A0ABD1QDX5_9LAMI
MKLVKKKVILIPYPAQGHVTPMLQLASVLLKFGLKPVMIVPEFIHHRLSPQINERHGILCISIPDGLHAETPRDFFSIDKAMEDYFPSRLDDVVRELNGDDGGILCFIVDLLASWAIIVANKYGVQVAGFWPAMHTTYRLIAAIPAMVHSGIISENGCPLHKSPIHLYPGQPTLTTDDLPWLIGSSAARSSRFKFWSRTLDRSNTLKWLLMNTFPDECHQKQLISTSCMQDVRQNFQIGPLNMPLDNKQD